MSGASLTSAGKRVDKLVDNQLNKPNARAQRQKPAEHNIGLIFPDTLLMRALSRMGPAPR